jgi:hypothetical protein
MARGQEDFAHIGPSTLAGRFLRRFWQPIFVASDLIKGRPVRVEALGEFFTLYRGESGQVHLVQDRCPHRQTSLSLGWVVGCCQCRLVMIGCLAWSVGWSVGEEGGAGLQHGRPARGVWVGVGAVSRGCFTFTCCSNQINHVKTGGR